MSQEEIAKRYGVFDYTKDKWLEKDGKEAIYSTKKEAQILFEESGYEYGDRDVVVREYPDPLTIQELAMIAPIGTKPIYSPSGHVIDKEGAVYSLIKAHTHGAICALLCTNVSAGKVPLRPLDEIPVFAWQRFELDNQAELDVVRISISAFTGEFNVSGSKYRVTERQIQSLISCANLHGIGLQGEIQTGGFKTVKLSELVDQLRQGKPLYDYD